MEARAKLLLAVLLTVGFLAVIIGMSTGVFTVKDNPSILMLFGALATNFGAVINYYFGSSQGSEAKTQMLADQIPKAPPPAA